MNAVALFTFRREGFEGIEGLSAERGRARVDFRRQRIHYKLVCANDVHSLLIMRHSQRQKAERVP